MRIIISPAKKMNVDNDSIAYSKMPRYIEKTKALKDILSSMTYEELKKLWKCNDKIAALNFERIKCMDLEKNLTPALLAYDGIQYKYMAPNVFTYEEFDYIEEHLRILSGFYGMLRPFDGVVPYRLEMQAALKGEGFNSLYEFWSDRIAEDLAKETDTVINLASKEYGRLIYENAPKGLNVINCTFGELINGRVTEKGTKCKMARGEMVRFMAENKITDTEGIKSFSRMGYSFNDELSDEKNIVFIEG